MRRYLVPLTFGLGGVAVLMSLGFWQLDRLEQKLDRLARIEAKIGNAPGDLLMEPDAGRDQYMPVSVSGDLLEGAARVLISAGGQGAGYRLISPFRLSDGRLVMIDEGYVGLTADSAPGEARGVTVSERAACTLVSQALRGLAFAHGRGGRSGAAGDTGWPARAG